MTKLKHIGAGLLTLALLSCTDTPESVLSVNGDSDHIDVHDDMGPVLRYQIAALSKDEPWRANYLHPVFSPSGAIVTENAPEDHIHHRGIFWSWRGLFVDGKSVGDAWVGDHISYVPTFQSYGQQSDGGVRIETGTLWRTDALETPTDFLREETTVTVWPEKDGSRRLQLRVALTALVPGVSIAGSDNEKGYGGLSFRFGRADKMDISSEGKSLTATPAPVETGDEVDFQFRNPPAGWPQSLSIACEVNDKPLHNWILRQELSMQNCAWPGRSPAAIPTDRPVVLSADITLR
ncbi:DUF6807 family protein [Kordiimonas gwangyangensis]|uniref:DUF6807 family protein n=1 Tax=Kordiimonas gwangyangensis TaxID=288022 RepID=UPI00037BA943|nr:DUF6807 family protein [Kordiimonas gwangyangensis]